MADIGATPLRAAPARAAWRYCGRVFTALEMEWIRALTVSGAGLRRAALSRRVCEGLDWRRPDGGLKEMSCRVAMLRMERDGWLVLPAPRSKRRPGRRCPRVGAASEPREALCLPADALGELRFEIVRAGKNSGLWNELIERHHYLGYQPLPGAQMRYLIWSGPHLLAAVGMGAAAWKVAARDRFIGWDVAQRQAHLQRVVNNARFLILPWIRSPNLGSRILSGLARRLGADWQARYGYAPVLLETFVERHRYRGTVYRAANWIHVGETRGRGKLDREHRHGLPVKDVFLYPLHKQFRRELGVAVVPQCVAQLRMASPAAATRLAEIRPGEGSGQSAARLATRETPRLRVVEEPGPAVSLG